MKLCAFGLHKWKPHYVRVKNVRQHHECKAIVLDAHMAVMCGMPPMHYQLVQHLGYTSGPGMVLFCDRCAKCGKRR